MNKQLYKKTHRAGFTLVELLVAVGVTALLVSMMLGIIVNITGGWNRSSGSLESGNQARVVLDQLTSDLQAAIIRNDSNVWMAAEMRSPSPAWTGSGNTSMVMGNQIPDPATTAPNLPTLEDYQFGPSGVWFRFFSTVPGTNVANDLTTLSAPRAVAYQIIRRDIIQGSSEVRYQLYRSEVLPNLTFNAGYKVNEGAYIVAGTVSNDPGTLRTPDRENVIANNVIDFGVRILDQNGGVLFPRDENDVYPRPPTVPPTATPLPDAVEIFVRILSSEGAQQISLLESGRITGDWAAVVQAHSRVYTRRVELKAKGL